MSSASRSKRLSARSEQRFDSTRVGRRIFEEIGRCIREQVDRIVLDGDGALEGLHSLVGLFDATERQYPVDVIVAHMRHIGKEEDEIQALLRGIQPEECTAGGNVPTNVAVKSDEERINRLEEDVRGLVHANQHLTSRIKATEGISALYERSVLINAIVQCVNDRIVPPYVANQMAIDLGYTGLSELRWDRNNAVHERGRLWSMMRTVVHYSHQPTHQAVATALGRYLHSS